MTELARKLRVVDYFTLGWGTMVGVGWLVVMDDWLLRGGALGGVLGFAIGGALLLPIGYVYGQLVMAMPDAAGEVAYTAKVFPQAISFATGWMMVLSYFIVCPWEAVAIGKIASYIFPSLDSLEVYRIAGRPVYLPHLVIGLGLFTAIWMAIVVGILFYTIVIAAVAYAAPWRKLTGEKFMTAVAFEYAAGSHWIVRVILVAALLSLFKVFNGNLVAASRLLFAMGRRGLVERKLAAVHPRTRTPSVAVICFGVATAACMFLADSVLVTVSVVVSVRSASV